MPFGIRFVVVSVDDYAVQREQIVERRYRAQNDRNIANGEGSVALGESANASNDFSFVFSDGSGGVTTAPLVGGPSTELAGDQFYIPANVAVDGSSVYFTSPGGDPLYPQGTIVRIARPH